MEVVRAKVLGYCAGVKRAVKIANELLDTKTDAKIYSLGPLIHNDETLSVLKNKGLIVVEENDLDKIPDGSTVVIRAHGVSPEVIDCLLEKKCKIADATCARVKNNQKMVERFSKEKDFVIITGDKNHGEVKGIEGYAGNNFVLVQNCDEALNFAKNVHTEKSAFLLSQTTFNENEFLKVAEILKKTFPYLEIENTICPATNQRQEALVELCSLVDGVLIIGGKNSANTKRLFMTAQSLIKKTAMIQKAEDIPEDFFALKRVGITAGASTSFEIIEKVEQTLMEKGSV
ncbi:MAG: 4-hydroxy-3-methylbut-2-enyl diphosphate reductase [Treponema sp.]|nr:4-hydroxy-3-methylbut-2-enyl diphosphate reductase [Treponema sp.]